MSVPEPIHEEDGLGFDDGDDLDQDFVRTRRDSPDLDLDQSRVDSTPGLNMRRLIYAHFGFGFRNPLFSLIKIA